MRIKILIRAFNDFDQILPIVDYIINNSHYKVEVFKTSKKIDLCHSHISYLKNELNIEIHDFYTNHMSKKEIKYLNLYNSLNNIINNVFSYFPYGSLFAGFIMFRLQTLFMRTIKKIVHRIEDQTVLLMDTGAEQVFPFNRITQYLPIRSRCYAHGYSVYTNLNPTKKRILSDLIFKDRIIMFLQNYNKRIYALKYLTSMNQKDTYYKSSMMPGFKDYNRVIEVGAPRFTNEWNNKFSKYFTDNKFIFGDSEKTNVVFF